MSQALRGATPTPPGANSAASAMGSEKNASSPGSVGGGSNTSAPPPKPRSCVICRSRKVRCDKLKPCSNCRRANIPCVFPAADRPPRWARRLDRLANNAAANPQAVVQGAADPGVDQVMERLRTLEGLVKELTSQLEQARAAVSSPSASISPPGSSSHNDDMEQAKQRDVSTNLATGNTQQQQFGRLVMNDANRSRYISSGFWSNVIDELNGLKMDARFLTLDAESNSSGDEMSPGKTPSTQELERTPSERHAFLFRHNLRPAAPDFRELHPLPSQIPFILNVFVENVNSIIQMVHVPTVTKMVRDIRFRHCGDARRLTPANEALLFSIYYAAITSMEEDEVMTNFGTSKMDLNLRYRHGLEHAFAKADFLHVPDIVLVQAFAIFLFLVRRYDSPRFVWMMTGLAVRMAQGLGLHRDGSHFEHLTPYDTEIRRRVWWALCILDVRASEDQGMDLTITNFDTKLPLNINDADIDPGSKTVPVEREGLTDMSISLMCFGMCDITRQMMALTGKEGPSLLDEQERLLKEIYHRVERGYCQYAIASDNIMYWVAVNVARLTMAKMTLIIYFPTLFSYSSASDEHFSHELRDRLLVSAIEVAEYNHALNTKPAARHWRSLYQTYTHWHAIVYLLIEICRRPWSPTIERAWVALHSRWLIPDQSNMDKNLRLWVPLRKLMTNARKHRDAELERLQSDPQAAERLFVEDHLLPGSPGPFPAGADAAAVFRERWRQLVAISPEHQLAGYGSQMSRESASVDPSIYPNQSVMGSIPTSDGVTTSTSPLLPENTTTKTSGGMEIEHDFRQPPYDNIPLDLSEVDPGFVPWPWADPSSAIDDLTNVDVGALDMSMDLEGDVNWYEWVESAQGMNWDTQPSGS